MGEPFKPLDFIRALGDDDELSGNEIALLAMMAVGTDNDSFKVRRSLSALSEMCGVGRDVVGRMIDRPQVAKYLDRVERAPRRVDIWMRQRPHVVSDHMVVARAEDQHVVSDDMSCGPTRHDMSSETTPSALSTPHLPNNSDAVVSDAPCFCASGEICDKCAPSAETDVGDVEMCDLHSSFPKGSCPPDWHLDARPSKYSDLELKQFHDKHLERDEGLNEFGEPPGNRPSANSWRRS